MEKSDGIKKKGAPKIRVAGELRFTIRLDGILERDLRFLYAWDKRKAIHDCLYSGKRGKRGNTGYLSFNMWLNKVLGDYVRGQRDFIRAMNKLANKVGALTPEDLGALRSRNDRFVPIDKGVVIDTDTGETIRVSEDV